MDKLIASKTLVTLFQGNIFVSKQAGEFKKFLFLIIRVRLFCLDCIDF